MSLILKNILHFWKSHLLILLSLALACAVIVAAFCAGDSLQKTLEDKALNRLGKVDTYLEKIGSFADKKIAGEGVVPLLSLDAIASANGLSRAVKFYVVDDDFWALSQSGASQNLGETAFVNETLAGTFGLEEGGEVALRLAFRESDSVEIPLSDSTPELKMASFKVSKILAPEDFGDFYLYDWQNSPANIFISYKAFAEKFSLKEEANFFLSKASKRLDLNLNFATLGLYSEKIPSGFVVKSKEVFLPQAIVSKIENAQNTLSWFISKIDLASSQDFNAFIVGAGEDLALGEVEINDVYARQHSLKIGDMLNLSYYVFDENLNLSTLDIALKVAKISPINDGYFYKEIVPDYDGLTNVDDCTKWKSSIPIDLKKISQKDKDYWENYGACPKLRVSYELAVKMFADSKLKSSALLVDREPSVLDFSDLSFASIGFVENSPKDTYLENARNGVDFKGLFLGLSFFVIFNALLLIYLVLKMNLTARQGELRLFKYLGFKRAFIEKSYLKEFFFSIVLGGLLGLFLGVLFSKVLLYFLNGIWGQISDSAKISFYLEASSLIGAFALSVFFGFVLLKVFTKRIFKLGQSLVGGWQVVSNFALVFLSLCFVVVLAAGVFLQVSMGFKALFSLLAYGLGLYLSMLVFRRIAGVCEGLDGVSFIFKRAGRTFSKSVYVILSLGVYILCVVGLNKIDNSKNVSSYAFFVKTLLATSTPQSSDFDMLSLRLKEASMANCLNLNKVTNPQVLGANIEALIDAQVISVKEELAFEEEANVFDAYVDESSMIWSLKASIGDTFDYDSQLGKVKLRIVGTLNPSVFQGSFIIKESDFKQLWGAKGAYNIFLAKPQGAKDAQAKQSLSKLFSPYLPDVNSCEDILMSFDSLQNSYLKIFYQLGLVALCLGLFGSLISMRNRLLNEREHLRFLHLLGFRRSVLSALIASEYMLVTFVASAFAIASSLPLINIADNYPKAVLVLVIVVVLNVASYPIVKAAIAMDK